MGTRTTDCRKFTPNIFNKSKCSHCFRQREEHSAAALECNRASRKVSKCGYLFVAPDWDFNNPLYRTKRWQRRWFVLYDDGELTYSVDEHPETVPQACIDMTKVLEVTPAEDVTGHSNSIAITAPERVTFVKGTCPEESKWWLNILGAFPKSKGRHKRNATFPVGVPNNRNRLNPYHKDTLTSQTVVGSLDVIGSSWDSGTSHHHHLHHHLHHHDSVISSTGQDENNKNAGNELTNRVYTDQPVSSKSPPTRDKIHPDIKAQARIRNRNRTTPSSQQVQDDSEPASSCLLIEDARHDEKWKDIANALTNLSHMTATTNNRCWSQQSNVSATTTTSSSSLSSLTSMTNINNTTNTILANQSSTSMDDKPIDRDETDYHCNSNSYINNNNKNINSNSNNNNNNNNNNSNNNTSHQDFRQIVNTRPKSLPLASNSTPAIVSAIVKKIPPVTLTNTDNNNKSSSSNNINKTNNNNINKSSPKIKLNKFLFNKNKNNNQSQERGDPDGGCNLDDLASTYLSKTAELRVNLPPANEEVLNLKKGWLLKQDSRTKEWTKHWFSLRGAALFYYRDPVTEERGVLDGVLDVNSLTNVSEFPTTSQNFGFQLTTWDNRRINLASISANARTNWINVLRNAAGLQSQSEPKPIAITDDTEPELIIKDNTSDDLKSEIEKDFIKAQRNQEIIINNLTIHEPESESPPTVPKSVPTPATPITTKTVLFSSDEEYRTASEGGRRDSVDWGSPLSPSPPISLSIFRAKERIRSRSGSSPRLHKRSRSSPPSSRRSTVDSIGSDELPLIHPVQEEFNIDKELQIRLGVAEKERDMLREEARERETRMSELLTTLERTELELTARIREVEEARDNLQRQLTEANSRAENVIARLTADLEGSQKKIKDFEDRLSRGIEENESLYKKLREMEGCSITNLNRSKMRRVDSLSDLTNLNEIDPYGLERDVLADEYNELKSRFEKAVSEIKAMKKELKESQNEFDSLEISYAALKQDLERKESEDRSQLQMMAERIQDLTLKYTASERQVRTLKQKLAKSERRRSSSLKGKEQVTIPKELEDKVIAMEVKIDDLEKLNQNEKFERCRSDSNSSLKKLSSQPRRKSLDSSGNTDSLQFMVRLNALDKRIENVSSTKSSLNTSNRKISEHLVERLKCLEGVLISSKDRIEQSLHQLHSLRSTRTRRSVSPITDRKDSLRFVERCLTEVIKLIRESCETCIVGETSNSTGVILLPESNPIKLALLQLEAQLRNKLGDLLKQRRVLKERNELSSRKNLELLAERIAFESVCFGKLKDSIDRAENPSLFGVKQTKAEIAETSQLMSTLKAKLGGKCAFKPSGSLDILAGVLARRLILSNYNSNNQQKMTELAHVDPKIMDELLRQQNEICLITKRYKNNAMETLAAGLAAETLSYISSNDSVQGAVQEAWRQAQETVNAELVQSEIANIMLKSAERFENAITPSFGYALTNEERVSFENFADAVHDSLRREMEIAIEQLTRKYEDSLQKMKRGQWRLHLEQERKASEGRQLLVEFADIMAHKALVDARIAVLKGEYVTQNPSGDQKLNFSVATLQKYENLFEELSNDLQICNPDDILTEADFNFMYKKYTIEFLSDKPHLREISAIFSKLEESIGLLHNALDSNSSIVISSVNFDNMDDICQKCQELKRKVDNVVEFAQKLTSTCKHCEKMQESLCSLTAQHETELRNLEQVHAKEIISLRKQIEDQINIVKCLGNEKNSLIEELTLQSNLVEDHEKELAAISLKLKNKEEECHRRDNENLDIMEKLEDQENQIKNIKEEKERLSNKCVRQDEEYAALLQERDYIQAELNKERERSRKLEKRLEMLEIEHSKQLECLQEAYKDQILSHCTDFTGITDEESFRQRYQTEIEQLRTLCEKGLAAMESSHRRIIADLEDKHRKEIERLLTEKEQALAEETQATLAALDAMRKAHQSEVQREVARFKQDFLKQFQKGEHCIDPVREKEEELEELRQEILSFSEKYSIKCVENAALEERLRAANQKLKQFQQMQQLELRNKQFRAHLASDNSSDLNFVQGLTSKEDSPCPDSEHADCCNEISAKNSNLCNEQTNNNNNNNDKYNSNNHRNYKKLDKEDDEENDVKVEIEDDNNIVNEDKDENNDKKHDEFDECSNVKIKSKNDTNNEGMIKTYRTFNDYNYNINSNDNNMTNNMNQQINDQFNNNKITTTITTKELSHYENNDEYKNKNVKSIKLASQNHKNDSDNKNKNLSSSSTLSFSPSQPSQPTPTPPPPPPLPQQEFLSTSLSSTSSSLSSSSYFVNNKNSNNVNYNKNLNKNINNNNNFNSYKKPVDEPKISKINTPKNFNSRCNLILKTNYNNNNNNDSTYHDDNNKNCILTNVSNVEKQYENSITTTIEQQQKQKIKHLIPNYHNNDQSNQINRYISSCNNNNDQHDQEHHNDQQQQIIANQSTTKLNDFQNIVETTRPNRNEIIKKRLAISLSSLSELLNNSNNCMRNNNYHNMNNNNSNNNNNNNPNNSMQIRMKHHQHQQKHLKDDSNLKKNFTTTTTIISNSDRNVVIDHLRSSLSLSSSSSSISTNNNHNDNNNNNKKGDQNEKYLINNNSSIISSTSSSSLSSLSSLSSSTSTTPTLITTASSSLFKQQQQKHQQQQQQQQQHQQQQFNKNQQHKQTVQTSMFSNNNLSIMSPTSIPTSTTSTTSTTNPSSISINKLIKCSPPPLNGRDVEHHHHHCTTSHLRRFELEI